MSNEVARSLLGTLHECQFDVDEYGIQQWLGYDFGGESQARTYLETWRVDDAWRAEIRSALEVNLGPEVGNAFHILLLLTFTPEHAVVESVIEAHLDVAIGTYGTGSHVLYRHKTEDLDFEDALRAAREHVRALYDVEDYPKTLGLRPR
ncbi:hypothetical protein [Asanoa iriomotensis]|uniref:Uncharacterized protein n=1 Tax=Asanoa iriomotensis TaxID=234613 RepID=A0ABQ4CBR2_9ACTN|nr:hypothetical protein [Asanoa iriomotensis]GIF60201.1 hypothetical protein Air01nite_62960 [Asanoa iriomotensis]